MKKTWVYFTADPGKIHIKKNKTKLWIKNNKVFMNYLNME